ncbi:hypothetical protein Psi02_55690 [Planotetraspora silvatica]|uniref:Uncharacterized protein n=1 Tax=Planotetraspora silvatica TaxID=234614 RepID=A0A8J3XQE0_9ACTN|nr:hypothetical protein [Planotetraspora silvatica]GII49145.1 hypothetical protein Psi02_55690 [Planotetraspora silvatica]
MEARACVTENIYPDQVEVSWYPWSLEDADGQVVEEASSWSDDHFDVALYPNPRRKVRNGLITLSTQSMHLEGTPGQRLGVYVAEPGTPDHDAMLLLDMTAPEPAAHPSTTNQAQRSAGTDGKSRGLDRR